MNHLKFFSLMDNVNVNLAVVDVPVVIVKTTIGVTQLTNVIVRTNFL